MKKKKKKVTKTEVAITWAATIVSLNLQQLLAAYLDLAHQHDIIPPPELQSTMGRSVNALAKSIERKPKLATISRDLIYQFIQRPDNNPVTK